MAQQTHQHTSRTRVGAFVCVAAAACLVWASAARASDGLSCSGIARQGHEPRPSRPSDLISLTKFRIDVQQVDVPGVVAVYPVYGPPALRGGAYEPYPLADGVFGLDLVWLGARDAQHILPIRVGYDRTFYGSVTLPHRGVVELLCGVLGDRLCHALWPRRFITVFGVCGRASKDSPFSAAPPAVDSLPTWWENWAEPIPLLADK